MTPIIPQTNTMTIADIESQGRILRNRMWPSLESAVWLYDKANIALIGALVLGVIATVLVVWMGNVKEEHLRRDIADTNERAANAELRASEANQKAEEEKLERMKLEVAIAPRTLSLEQQRIIADSWRAFAGRKVRLITYSLDVEGASIGQQVIACLESSGINVGNGIGSKAPISGFAAGILVDGADEALVNAIVKELSQVGRLAVGKDSTMFNVAGMATGVANEPASSFAASILVGVKPMQQIRQ